MPAEADATVADDRLPAATRPGAVRLQVGGLARSLAFYTDVLGFRVLRQDDGAATLGAADPTPLLEVRQRAGSAPASPRARLGLFHVAYLLPDRPALGRFLRHAAERGVRVGAGDHLVSEALYLADPDGLGIEVYADRPRAEWRMTDGEIAMATDPLDLADLAAAANGLWTGMPAGTRVGHVHLHVGDLEAATAFYATALGLEPTVRRYPGARFLAAGGYHHHLGVNTWAGPQAQPAAEDEARLLRWTLELPTAHAVQAAASRLAAAGYVPRQPDDVAPPAVEVRDPWGTALLLRTAPSDAAA